MQIVIISDFGHVNGGAAKVAIESARGLAEAGHQVVYVCAVDPVSELLEHERISVKAFSGQNIWNVKSRFDALKQALWNKAANEFVAEVLKRQPSGAVIHIHQWSKAFSPSVIGAAAASNLPVLVTLHDYFAFCPVGSYFDYRARTPCQLKPMGAACITRNCDRASYAHKVVRVARQWFTNSALDKCHDLTFIHVSNVARRVAEPFLPSHAGHHVIENMVEANSGPLATPAKNGHLLFLGRFSFEKGALLLAEAAARTETPVRFVGEGELAAEMALINPQADIRGWIHADNVGDEIRQARAVVVPSYFETGPLVAPQAWAMGVPVILTTGTGAAGWVGAAEQDWVAQSGSVDDLARVLTLTKNDEEVSRVASASYQRYQRDPFTISRHLALATSLYEQVLGADVA